MSRPPVALLGAGHAVPAGVRLNDDPVFARVREGAAERGIAEHTLFVGNRERRVLAPGEEIEDFVVEASRAALQRAGVAEAEVSRLLGYVSVSEFLAPNSLFRVHRDLGLSRECLVIPVNSEFSNFLVGVILSWEAILAGHADRCLVACGGAWTRSMDYTQGHSLGIGDGAGAAVVGVGERMVLVDYLVETLSDEYGVMRMARRPESGLDHPTYALDPTAGVGAFLSTGMESAPRMVGTLLERHGITAADVTLVGHQASRMLMDHWAEKIRPGAYLDTYEEFGNVVLASVPVTLSRFWDEIRTPWLVLFALGIGAHQVALLVKV